MKISPFIYLNGNAIVFTKILLVSDIYQQDKKYCFHILLEDKVTVEYTHWSKEKIEQQHSQILQIIETKFDEYRR